MSNNEKRRPDPLDPSGAHENQHVNSIPCHQEIVNLESPRLWRAFRKFNRNFKRMARLQEENARLLDVMRRAQGGEVRHVA